MADLHRHYIESIRPTLMEQFSYKNMMEVPRLVKITLNMGVGEAVGDKKIMDNAVNDMMLICGQKPVVNNARKSEAGFKIREGYPVGCKVTLRGARMFEFLERLVGIAIPRMRDFRGSEPAFVRRPRQFLDGRDRADHFPRNRLRQNRRDSGHGHHGYHDGTDQCGRSRAAQGIQFSVPRGALRHG